MPRIDHAFLVATVIAAMLNGPALWSPAHADSFRETELSEPEPDFAQPRRVMLQLTSDDETTINNILHNAINIQKFYGMDNVEVAVIVYGPGMEALYADTSPVKDRITSQQKYGVEFIGCGNTMEATGHEPEELISGVEWVEAGVAEIVERQLDGWAYVRP